MENFIWYVPTKIYFGKGQLSHLREMKECGDRVLLVYGGGSIKKLGIYDEALAILKGEGMTVFELGGVEPNPKVELVRKGVDLCRRENIDMVLGIGGGSVLDTAKAVAAGAKYDGDVWDFVGHNGLIKDALPIFTVLTMSATGSEMNKNAVISDMSRNLKEGISSDLLKPRMSICDPTYTFSVSMYQTAAGTADIMSHTFEVYFADVPGGYLTARFGEAVLRTCVKYGPIALSEPDNYEARANLMWASTTAINGLTKLSSTTGWSCHPIEHELSAWYDITHGVGLAILTPRWMRHILSERTMWKFAEYGREVWGLEGDDEMVANAAIERTGSFLFDTMKLPRTLGEVGIDSAHFAEMAAHAAPAFARSYVPLSEKDILAILNACL